MKVKSTTSCPSTPQKRRRPQRRRKPRPKDVRQQSKSVNLPLWATVAAGSFSRCRRCCLWRGEIPPLTKAIFCPCFRQWSSRPILVFSPCWATVHCFSRNSSAVHLRLESTLLGTAQRRPAWCPAEGPATSPSNPFSFLAVLESTLVSCFSVLVSVSVFEHLFCPVCASDQTF